MVPVEVAEDGKEAEEDGAMVKKQDGAMVKKEDGAMVRKEAAEEDGTIVPLAEEPEALKTLVSCGAHWQLQCLHGEQLCQKHAVAKAFMEMVPVQDSPR